MIEVIGFVVGCGFFPCLLFGIIMLISFLTCDYIEKFVVKTFCSFKNRRRRFRDKSSLQSHLRPSKKEGKQHKTGSIGGEGDPKQRTQLSLFHLSETQSSSANLPSTSRRLPETQQPQQEQQLQDRHTSSRLAFDDPPPAYHECVARSSAQIPYVSNDK